MPSTSSARVEILPPFDRGADEMAQLDWLANLMDSRFHIPGTNFRVGLDAFLGLIPGVGDGLGALISFYILQRLWQFDLPWYVRGRMVINILLDVTLGAIPLIGDIFDFGFKANTANLTLVKTHLARRKRFRRP